MTYTALAILAMCGDDFSRVGKDPIIRALRKLQRVDGSFCPVAGDSENDMRFVYCAASVSYMLNDFSGIDIPKVVQYIKNSQSFDAAIGQGPGLESHGGSTYCAIAALKLMGKLDELPRKKELIQWCVERQVSGFQGRINKDADTCYSFWIGATLSILGAHDLVDFATLRGFNLSCEQPTGGLSKVPGSFPDVLHTYLGLCGLSLGGEKGLAPIDPSLGFSVRAAQHVQQLHKK